MERSAQLVTRRREELITELERLREIRVRVTELGLEGPVRGITATPRDEFTVTVSSPRDLLGDTTVRRGDRAMRGMGVTARSLKRRKTPRNRLALEGTRSAIGEEAGRLLARGEDRSVTRNDEERSRKTDDERAHLVDREVAPRGHRGSFVLARKRSKASTIAGSHFPWAVSSTSTFMASSGQNATLYGRALVSASKASST